MAVTNPQPLSSVAAYFERSLMLGALLVFVFMLWTLARPSTAAQVAGDAKKRGAEKDALEAKTATPTRRASSGPRRRTRRD
mmetsp:Transcript_17484/g.53523  ORF Transcript_17484/g.53523 Transcript_17484/m.53523 type:complete len:81 (-) Transcript_17484:134-376(-)|eukprot:CAMPEP_0118858404 /NCGR_PEP_ID=MMETSP1163-20130328/5086_1 /TAXON_ID=124430 /ORGANISM="Phaeomonas parva, Strain CCMP2877" /LENGTH=80 /DNA_ID=CAMNT_0006791855 /DNA_START=95 /DNA_END=337 /DNA_ORIENTATION=+